MTAQPNLAILGLGQMGAPVARLLLAKGHNLTLWNRSHEKAESLANSNTRIASSPADAAAHANIVFTMLTDDAATEAVLFGDKHQPGFLDALKPGAIHVTLSTISTGLARRITAAHQERGQHHIGAPVFGRPAVAEAGRLWIVTSGEDEPLARVRPLLESISRGLTIVSREPWQAHALKLGGNLMITSMNQTLSEAFVFAESQGIDPALFHQAINSALFQSQLYENYGKTILNPPAIPGATVSLGIKDTRLAREAAAEAGIRMRLADYFADVLHRAKEAGFADADWAVGQYRIAQSDAPIAVSPALMEPMAQFSLSSKIAFITGASAGIGLATARAFAAHGARLILAARRVDRLEAERASLTGAPDILTLQLDVTDHAAVEHAVNALPAAWQAIDILVNNAGLSRGLDKLYEGKRQDWEEMIDTNVKGLLYVTRAVVPGMVQRSHGHIVNLGSTAGRMTYPNGAVYCATKAAERSITEGLREDLLGTPLRVTTIDPGMVETEFSEVRFRGDKTRAAKVYQNVTPLKPEDIADAILYAVTRPAHVNISEVMLTPVAQANSLLIHRNG